MAKRIEKIFNECLKRVENGDSIEGCLQRFPVDAPELEPLLRTYLNIRWRGSMVRPRPEFKAKARAEFIRAQYIARPIQPLEQKRPGVFTVHRVWAATLAGALIFLLVSTVGTAAASVNSMPDEPLYNVKLATEQVKLTFAFSDADKAIVNTELAETRSQEIEVMAAEGKTDQVINTAVRLAQNLENADVAINKVVAAETKGAQTTFMSVPAPVAPVQTPIPGSPETVPTPPTNTIPSTEDHEKDNRDGGEQNERAGGFEKTEQLKQSYSVNIDRNLRVLESALNKAPEKARPTIQHLIDIAKNNRDKITSGTGNQDSEVKNENNDDNGHANQKPEK